MTILPSEYYGSEDNRRYFGHSLSAITEQSTRLDSVLKSTLRPGDVLIVRTRNSVYSLRALSGGYYAVTGGWFNRSGRNGSTVRINGCTWGGSIIKSDIAAARGLCIEFGNRVVTSPVKKIFVFSVTSSN